MSRKDHMADTKGLEKRREGKDMKKEESMRKEPEKRKSAGPVTVRKDTVAKNSRKESPDKKDFKPKPKADLGKAMKTMDNKGYAKANSATKKSGRGR